MTSILFDSEALTYTTFDYDHESWIQESNIRDQTYIAHMKKALKELKFRLDLGVKAV